MADHTLAVGAVPAAKYGKLGGHRGRMLAPPAKIAAFIFSLPGDGKTCFSESHPEGFIINMDATSTTNSQPLATTWPGVDATTGMLTNDAGQPFILEYEHVMEKLAILKELAKSNQPRPQTIFIDSLSAWIRLLKNYIAKHAQDLSIGGANNVEWKSLNGKASWDYLYDHIIDVIADLKNHGYGVYVLAHIVKSKIPIGENLFAQGYEFTITDNFWKRLYAIFELSAVIAVEVVSETKQEKGTMLVRGKEQETVRTVTREVRKHFLCVNRTDLAGMAKGRVNFDKIELPATGAWEAFETAYRQAANTST